MATPVPCQKATCPAGATCVAGTDNACTVTGGSSTDCTNQTGLTCAPGMYKVSKYTSASNGAKGPTCELSCQECGCVAAAPSPPPSSFAARLGDAPAAGTCIQDEGGAMVCTTSVTDQQKCTGDLTGISCPSGASGGAWIWDDAQKACYTWCPAYSACKDTDVKCAAPWICNDGKDSSTCQPGAGATVTKDNCTDALLPQISCGSSKVATANYDKSCMLQCSKESWLKKYWLWIAIGAGVIVILIIIFVVMSSRHAAAA